MDYLKTSIFIALVFFVFSVAAYNGFYLALENLIFTNESEASAYFSSPRHLLTAPWIFFGVPIVATALLSMLFVHSVSLWFRVSCSILCCAILWVYFAVTYGEVGVLSGLDLKAIVCVNAVVIPVLYIWQYLVQRGKRVA
jgi:hypothetical protein